MRKYTAMGDSATTTATQAAMLIVSDPYLKEAACEVMRLSNTVSTGSPGGNCPRTDPRYRGSRTGVGLENLVGPLRLYTYHRQNPWVIPLAAGVGAMLIFYLGMEYAKK